MNKTITVLIIIVALLVAGVIYATYALDVFDRSNVPSPSVSATATPTGSQSPTPSAIVSPSQWQTYRNDDYGVEMKYPADFSIESRKDSVRLVVPVKSYFRTVLANEARIDISKPAPSCPASEGDQLVPAGNVKAEGATFEKFKWSGVGAGQLYVGADYQAKKNNLCYSIHVYTHSANGAGFYYTDPGQIEATNKMHTEDTEKFLNLIDNIVATFKFAK